MKFSVVIISYNSKKTVIDTLNSVADQEFKDYELIISDDGSKDGTQEIIEEWLEKHKDIKALFIRNPTNMGTTYNCVNAIKHCTTKYVKLIAADDIFTENSFFCISKSLDANPDSDIFIGKMYQFTSESNVFDVKSREINCAFRPFDYEKQLVKLANAQSKHDKLNNTVTVAPSMILNIKSYTKIGGYDTSYKLMEDLPYITKCIMADFKFTLLDDYIVYYRISQNSIAHSNDRNKYTNEEFFEEYFNYFIKERKGILKQERNYKLLWNESINLFRNKIIVTHGNTYGFWYKITKPLMLLTTNGIKNHIKIKRNNNL